MNKTIIMLLAVAVTFFTMVPAYAFSSCEGNTIVRNWINERDNNALKVVKAWVADEPKEVIASYVGLLWANETNIVAKCRKESNFLRANLLVYGDRPISFTLETAPPLIIQQFLNDDILSPLKQYEETKTNKGGAR